MQSCMDKLGILRYSKNREWGKNEALLKWRYKTMNYGLQMYSVRDITEKDLAGALKKVATG